MYIRKQTKVVQSTHTQKKKPELVFVSEYFSKKATTNMSYKCVSHSMRSKYEENTSAAA